MKIKDTLQIAIHISFGWKCLYCGRQFSIKDWKSYDLTQDHIVPVKQGGKNHWGNLATACRKCNLSRGSKTIEEFCKLHDIDHDEVRRTLRNVFRRSKKKHRKLAMALIARHNAELQLIDKNVEDK